MLLRLALVLVVLGAAYSALIVLAVPRLGARWSWLVWAGTLVLLASWGVWKMSLFPGVGTGLTVYFFAAFLGLPLALATWAVQRGYRRKPERRAAVRVGWGLGAFLVALPLGFLIAVIPDAMALFR
jgi:hypothetical protein